MKGFIWLLLKNFLIEHTTFCENFHFAVLRVRNNCARPVLWLLHFLQQYFLLNLSIRFIRFASRTRGFLSKHVLPQKWTVNVLDYYLTWRVFSSILIAIIVLARNCALHLCACPYVLKFRSSTTRIENRPLPLRFTITGLHGAQGLES